MTAPKRRAAKRPAPRTVTVKGTGEYADWECTAKADYPAAVLIEWQSEDMARIVGAFGRMVIDHNFPDEHGELATSMAEVDPYDGVVHMAGRVFDAIGNLPPR